MPLMAGRWEFEMLWSVVQQKEKPMLWTIIAILFVLWLIGLIGHIGGGLIHILLVAAVIIFLINLFTGRRAVV
jgi:hypothetical protein